MSTVKEENEQIKKVVDPEKVSVTNYNM